MHCENLQTKGKNAKQVKQKNYDLQNFKKGFTNKNFKVQIQKKFSSKGAKWGSSERATLSL